MVDPGAAGKSDVVVPSDRIGIRPAPDAVPPPITPDSEATPNPATERSASGSIADVPDMPPARPSIALSDGVRNDGAVSGTEEVLTGDAARIGMLTTEGVRVVGMLAEGALGEGVRTEGTLAEGVLTEGVLTGGVLTGGVLTEGVLGDGVGPAGVLTDGV